jgi:glucose uptake protein
MGLFVPVLENCMPGDLGLGPYAGMLLFGVGLLVSTVVYNFYLLNITIEGAPLSFGAYFRGNLRQHLLGFAGGALCLGGLLAAALGNEAPASADVPGILNFLLPLLSVPLAFLFGISIWKELSHSGSAKKPLLLGFVLFLVGLGLLSTAYAR